ncbi:hypothetical protein DPMN_062784 [Dreissena polymorpha]|uniref:Uncharacterized protein n=1 Tax=Dreissena polymorpha TaxID=45954 RepID=A0A9D4HI17_DREPO|nr:hypothetical protein DPMN_062784 [Dreissena polymorpha]
MRGIDTLIFRQSGLLWDTESNSSMGRKVHLFTFSIHHLSLVMASMATLLPIACLGAQSYTENFQVLEAGHLVQHLFVHCDVCSGDFGIFTVMFEFSVLIDIHPICRYFFIDLVVAVWEFSAGATNEVNVIRQSEVGDRGVLVLEGILNYLWARADIPAGRF